MAQSQPVEFLKSQKPSARVKSISQVNDRLFQIDWTDGLHSQFDTVELRRKCPCATCKDEWTHEQILKPENVPDSIRPVKIESVGQYALSVQFTDGHKTGIYPFSLLRKISLIN
ncbi:MAG: DUF971 domain-containing protein [Proteobacteria bacterium]|nr:DUF971 domain-containing protein [Pseudomonadota bacterium]